MAGELAGAPVPDALRGRVWLDLASALAAAGDPGWAEPLARAEDLARRAGDDLLLVQVLGVRTLALARRDPEAAAVGSREVLAVAGRLHSPAVHHGAIVRVMLVDPFYGRSRVALDAGHPSDQTLAFDLSARTVASWLEPPIASRAGPDDLSFVRAIALLAVGEPGLAARAIGPEVAGAPALAALALAHAEHGDLGAAHGSLERASAQARWDGDLRIVRLAGAHLALAAGEAGAADRAREVLAAGSIVVCAPGVTREPAIDVCLVRSRLEDRLARG